MKIQLSRKTLIFLTLVILIAIATISFVIFLSPFNKPEERLSKKIESASKKLESGLATHDRKLLEKSEKEFENLLKSKPADLYIIENIVTIKNELLKRDEGISIVKDAIASLPPDSTTDLGVLELNIGILYDQKGDRDKARIYYQESLKHLPNFPRTYVFLSRLAVGDNNPVEIRYYAQKAIEYSNSPVVGFAPFAYAMLAESYSMEGNNKSAEVAARKALKLDPLCKGCYHILGEILLDSNLDEAISNLEKSLELDPRFSHSYYHLGLAHLKNGEKEKAIQIWEKGLQALNEDPNFPEWYKPKIKLDIENALESQRN